MRVLRLSTQIHKWIALVVSVQVLFWVGGGLVMTVIPIERVRSEHRMAEHHPQPLRLAETISPTQAARAAGISTLQSATLTSSHRGTLWVLTRAEGEPVAVDARSGAVLPPVSSLEARALAQAAYRGPGEPIRARFFTEAPQETGKEGPLWRVDFDDPEGTAFYLAPHTGEVVTRRSNLWRFYDFMWRLHILDFERGEDFNHPLIITAAALALVMVLAGFVLLWIRLVNDLRSVRGRRGRP